MLTHLEKLSWGTRGDLFSCSMASWGEGAGKGSTRLGGLPGLTWELIMTKHIIRDRYSGIFMIKGCSFWPKRGRKKEREDRSAQAQDIYRGGGGKKHVVFVLLLTVVVEQFKSCCLCLNCCFSLIYKVFMGAFNLYNPEYLSLLYNIYFTFLFRGVFKKVSRKFSEIRK